ncbi:hypothetical protein BD779DRAFT_1798316 [Infundibulicybe gibba]|nr:hypothetical protein BD779DRAFT_1798316 [Infundibulicybe gibba]
MAKRKFIPAGLHSELTEYTSLLRALRTSDTLDVTSQLIKAPLFHRNDSQPPQNELADMDDSEDLANDQNGPALPQPQPPSTDTPPTNAAPTAGPSTRPDKRTRMSTSAVGGRRDTWTRWPLLAGDVTIPEWGMSDEISHIVSQILKHQSRSPEDEEIDSPAYMPYLADIGEHFLSRILALLAFNVPIRPQSMQNRLEPLDWRIVLDAAAATGDTSLANSRIIDNVKKRMETIYGPAMSSVTECNATHRIQLCISSTEKLAASLDAADADLFKFPDAIDIVSQPPARKGKRKAMTTKLRTKKSKTV